MDRNVARTKTARLVSQMKQPRLMLRRLLLIFALVGCCFATDYKKCTVLDIHSYQNNIPVDINGTMHVVHQEMYVITVQMDDIAITGIDQLMVQERGPSEMVIGDEVEAKVKDNTLIVKKPSGKKLKASIIKREHIQQ
jgi:hypothetical protein